MNTLGGGESIRVSYGTSGDINLNAAADVSMLLTPVMCLDWSWCSTKLLCRPACQSFGAVPWRLVARLFRPPRRNDGTGCCGEVPQRYVAELDGHLHQADPVWVADARRGAHEERARAGRGHAWVLQQGAPALFLGSLRAVLISSRYDALCPASCPVLPAVQTSEIETSISDPTNRHSLAHTFSFRNMIPLPHPSSDFLTASSPLCVSAFIMGGNRRGC